MGKLHLPKAPFLPLDFAPKDRLRLSEWVPPPPLPFHVRHPHYAALVFTAALVAVVAIMQAFY
jgi:hypothetical protein